MDAELTFDSPHFFLYPPPVAASPAQRLVDKGLAAIVRGCPQMLPDKLAADCKGDDFLFAVANQHPNLTEIDISKCGAVTDRGLAYIVTHCPNLVPNKIPSLSKGDLFCTVVAKIHPSLTILDLHDCQAVTDGFVCVFVCLFVCLVV